MKKFDHTPEYKAKIKAWREHHTKLSAPDLHDLGMKLNNGPHTIHQVCLATGLSRETVTKIKKFEHGGFPMHSTIVALQRFFGTR